MEWLEQDIGGCGIAVAAMLTGDTYIRVKDAFPHFSPEYGIDHDVLDQYLADKGYAIRCICKVNGYTEELRPKWPVRPFAPQHYALVYQTKKDFELGIKYSHFVALDDKFNVFDPADKEYTKCKLSRYYKVIWIKGVYKV